MKSLSTECETEVSCVMGLPKSARDARSAGEKFYFTGKPCSKGHISKRYTISQYCVQCSKEKYERNSQSEEYREERNAKQRDRYSTDAEFRAHLKEKRDARRSTREYWDRENERMRNKRKNDEEFRKKSNEYAKEYASKPEQKAKRKKTDAERYKRRKAAGKTTSDERREYMREYMRRKIASDGGFRLDLAFSAAVRRSLGSSKGGRSWETLVGYSLEALKIHLEQRFQRGMSWENYGRGGWHIDHIIPRSAFNYQTPQDIDFNRCWALENLQPLWEFDNISKGAKLDGPFQPSLALPIPANDNKPPQH